MLEAGNVPGAALAGLEAAVALLEELGTEAIFARISLLLSTSAHGGYSLLALSFRSSRPRRPPTSCRVDL